MENMATLLSVFLYPERTELSERTALFSWFSYLGQEITKVNASHAGNPDMTRSCKVRSVSSCEIIIQ